MYSGTNAAPSYPPPTATNDERPLVAVTLDLIRSARQRVETLAGRSVNIADRVFGAVPSGVSGAANKSSEPQSAKASLELELRELHNAIEWLDSQITRLDRVA